MDHLDVDLTLPSGMKRSSTPPPTSLATKRPKPALPNQLNGLNASMQAISGRQFWHTRIVDARDDESEWKGLLSDVLMALFFEKVKDNLGVTVVPSQSVDEIVEGFSAEVFKEWKEEVRKCLNNNDWESLISRLHLLHNGLLHLGDEPRLPGPEPSFILHQHEIPQNLESFRRAFETEFENPFPDILLSTMDLYSKSETQYYNRSFSIIQSSGMGKSRLVDHSAKLRFTFPFNLHERMALGFSTYPPFDHDVRDYLTVDFQEEGPALTRHLAFLEALFTLTVTHLKSCKPGTVEDVALQWYEWLNNGATSSNVGTNRTKFYASVIKMAQKLEAMTPTDLKIVTPKAPLPAVLKVRRDRLAEAANIFSNCLLSLHGEVNGKYLAIAYFDESHTLHNGLKFKPYFSLMHVLSTINASRIFFVFLSTNSSLNALAPPDALYPSLRLQGGFELIPPFFELPFHQFCSNFTTEVGGRGKLTLDGVCELEQMVKFGRPMWRSHYVSTPQVTSFIHPTISLAMMKLGSNNFAQNKDAQLAALDCRVLIQYDPISTSACATQAKLVEFYMRCVLNITKDRKAMSSMFLSEPTLAEAAARLLNSIGIVETAPRILESALNDCLLARGERGELVARTLLTVAHDRAILKRYPNAPAESHFHRPILLLELLESLVAPDIWTTVRNALPFHAYQDSPTLECAFQDAWVNFSHFVRLGDHVSFNINCGSELMKLGAAIQTFDNQYNQDIGIPFLDGNTSETVISPDNSGMCQIQVRNTATPVRTYPDPTLPGLSIKKLPILSLCLQLGTEDRESSRVCVESIDKGVDAPAARTRQSVRSQPDDIHRRHYIVTLYGCTSETFSCIQEQEGATAYRRILKTGRLFNDFPRAGFSQNVASLSTLRPVIHDTPDGMPWRR